MQGSGVTVHSPRLALVAATRDLHDRLDRGVGLPADLPAYRRYLAATWRFRSAVEPALAGAQAAGRTAGWQFLPILPALGRDIAALGMIPPGKGPALTLTGMDEALGALYVVEGSALGARLIGQRAQDLGLGPARGAGHLAAQRGEAGRWRQFLDRLQGVGPDIDLAVPAARRVFALALEAHDLAGVSACPQCPPI